MTARRASEGSWAPLALGIGVITLLLTLVVTLNLTRGGDDGPRSPRPTASATPTASSSP